MTTGPLRADVCVVGLGPAGWAVAARSAAAGMRVVAVDAHPDKVWIPTLGLWADELPAWLPRSVIAAHVQSPAVWTTVEHRIERPYCVLSKTAVREALPLDGVRVVTGQATAVHARAVQLADGKSIRADTVIDARGLPAPGQRPAASAHGIFVDADRAAGFVGAGEALLLDWRDESGAGPDDPPSFLYSTPVDDHTVIFEETSLGLPGGMSQRELRRRVVNRLAAHGVTLTGQEHAEAAHYPLDQPPPPVRRGDAQVAIPFGSRGGMMHPCTGYSVGDSLGLADTLVDAVRDGKDPIRALWPAQARAVYWMRARGLSGMGRLTTAQSISMFDAFFSASDVRQRALLSEHADAAHLAAVLFSTVGHTFPFSWRFDLVGWRNRDRWVGHRYH